MSITRILIFCCLLFAGNAFSQGFLRSYTPESSMAREILQTTDGGYFMAGQVTDLQHLFLTRTDAAGQIVWENHLALNNARAIAACAAPDGGFVVLLENYWDNLENRNAVIKLDASGALQWTTPIPNVSIANGLSDLIYHSEGNIMVTGTTRDANFNTRNWLIKIAPDGSIIWDKIFGTEGRVIKQIIELPSGEVAVSGHLSDFYLAKLNTDGDLLWERDFFRPLNQINYDLLATTDGNIALLGTTPDPNNGTLTVCILKTDLGGNLIWLKTYYPFPTGSDALPVLDAFTQDNSGNFYIPFWGFIDSPYTDLELLKLSPDGTALWKHSLEMPGNAFDILKTNDNYLAIAGDNNGFPTNAMFLKIDLEGEFLSNKIVGNIFRDDDVDCLLSSGEPGLADYVVKAKNALGEVFYKKTNPDGSYEMRVTEGAFALTVTSVNAPVSFYAQCDTPTVSIVGVSQTVNAPAIGVQVLGGCPLLSVEVSAGLLRRCTTTVYKVAWCNSGVTPAENTVLRVIKDPLLIYFSSSLPLASQSGDTLFFDLGEVPVMDCNDMQILFKVDCAASLNDVVCVEAHIWPDSTCMPSNINWDGSKIEVTGSCNGSEIEFVIKNTGTGNMIQSADYVIIEDQIMFMQAPLQLAAGEEMTSIRIPMPDDSCFALQVFPNQTSLLSRPVAVVANCASSNGNLSLLLQLPNNENELATAIHCDQVRGSYDPNDKVGFPQGLTPAHYIEKGQDIEYRIRFQNTGNDTAFLIRVVDTLPATLDPASIRPIAGSHEYTWDVSKNGIITFTFANILLPDSTTNEPLSHGFISFHVSQQPNLPDGTLINNSASIYFDFNEPVLTNTWQHTIGRPETVSTKNPADNSKQIEVFVSPNPMMEEAHFVLTGAAPQTDLRFTLFDSMGKTLEKAFFSGNDYTFKNNNRSAGLYFWQIESAGKVLGRGRIAVSGSNKQ